ncbi:type II CRISPR RNA-guided endonuclease Cas9 [Streptococcus ruminantium]|uniref:type II CRISPR RNA-guided endonuclease Cas9 n=2 Tax=Streptococcus ruminantium TaxID=1917441 RepID=UPI0012DE27A3|nr:type II CRISPR RNA-guided endonuclease Cas9 [Streptococcus ruminantium]
MSNGKILGLDIGIASVGVGIIDAQTGEVVHASSRIFPSANAANNAERRAFRGSRRLVRRKKHRIKRLDDLFAAYQVELKGELSSENPYILRVKGLSQKLTVDELYVALKNIMKRRGISYLDDAEADGEAGQTDYAKAIERNRKLLDNKTPGEIQLDRLEKYGQLRGNFTIIDDEGQPQQIINVFSTSDYAKEVQQILECQKAYHTFISDDFCDNMLHLLTGKRKYYIGPGNEKSRTDYGVYRTDGTTLKNLFDILIGKCTFYKDENRSSKASYTAQEFNFLNDLNNLTVPTETKKLSQEQKEYLVEYAKYTTTLGAKKVLQQVAKLVGCEVDDIKGYRLDNKDKPDMHTFEVFRAMKGLVPLVDIEDLSREQLDTLADELTLNTDFEGIQEALDRKLPGMFNHEQVKELASFRKAKSQLFARGWHSLSQKMMLELIPELYATSEEQMTILTRLGKFQKNDEETVNTNTIKVDEVVEEIYNPVVAKSIRQTIKIINAATKKWGEFDQIVIEMPRDRNEDEEKKRIADGQKANAKEKVDSIKRAAELYCNGKELPDHLYHGHKQLATKIRLWYQQGERCIYTGQPISIHDLIHNQNQYEIDHILPLSLTFDDSLSNKVLVLATANQEKGQRTPYRYLQSTTAAWSYREFKDYVNKCRGLGKKKREYLIFEEDIDVFEVKSKFIQRNLVDTRYASRVILNALQDYYKTSGKSTKVSVVRGQFTSQLRRKWGIEKTRETYHHHAIDALIIAASSQLKLWKKQENPLLIDYQKGQQIDLETGEILELTDEQYKELVYQPPYQGFVHTISSPAFEDEILFSYQIDSKVNRKLSDATIYATRKAQLGKDKVEETYVLGKIKDIYTQAGYEAFSRRYHKDKTSFLMYQKDPDTWEKVIEIILRDYREFDDKGKEVGNPFERYYKENGYIKKYSRKGNGPAIKSLKYYDNKLGNHINITPENSRNAVVLQSLYPWRGDVYFNPESGKYELLGLKYSDLRYQKRTGDYGITQEQYNVIKVQEGISEESKFKFTLYKNDLLLVCDSSTKEKQLFRFLSRTLPNQKHYVELKPYDKAKFDAGQELLSIFGTVAKGGQCIKGLGKKNISIYKVRTDVLGFKYFIKQEGDQPQLNFKNK